MPQATFSYAEEYLPMLYNALEEEIGYFVRTDQVNKLRNILIDARVKSGDDSLNVFIFFMIEPDVLYIAKRSAEIPE